jgi:hypothetical protein
MIKANIIISIYKCQLLFILNIKRDLEKVFYLLLLYIKKNRGEN